MENKTKNISIIIFYSALIMLVSCKQHIAEWKGTIEEENGVTVVKNPREPMYSENVFSLEEEISIGEVEGRKQYMFSELRSIAVDNKERIYVCDRAEAHIKVFDKNGEYLNTISRKGQGPGELDMPNWLSITHQNELMVYNSRNRSLTFFTLDGKYINSLSTAKIYAIRPSINSKKNIILASYKFVPPNSIFELKMYDSALNFLVLLGSYSEPMGGLRDDYPFTPIFWWQIANNDNIVYGYSSSYEIQVFNSEGKLIKRILKEYDPVEITEGEREEYIKNSDPGFKFHFPKYHSAYQRFTLDEEGSIFIQTWEKEEDRKGYYYDVFDSEGKYISKIFLKVRPQVWKNNKLYTIEEDESGFQMVKRYKVTWRY